MFSIWRAEVYICLVGESNGSSRPDGASPAVAFAGSAGVCTQHKIFGAGRRGGEQETGP